jgi:hypothetical protein
MGVSNRMDEHILLREERKDGKICFQAEVVQW